MDNARDGVAKRQPDVTQRAMFDSIIEAFNGTDAARSNISRLFVPYPDKPISQGQSWDSDTTFPFLVPHAGDFKIPEKDTYTLQSDGAAGRPALIFGHIAYGPPGKIGDVELQVAKAASSYNAFVDRSRAKASLKEIQSYREMDIDAFFSNATTPRKRYAEVQNLTIVDVTWRAASGQASPMASSSATGTSSQTNPADMQSAGASYDQGCAKYRKGDLDGAIADLTRAISCDPELQDAYFTRGAAKYKANDLNGAIVDFTQAIALDPTDSRTLL